MFSIIIVASSTLLFLLIGFTYILCLPESNLDGDTNELSKFQRLYLLWNNIDENIFLLIGLCLMAVVMFLLWQCDWFSNCTTGYQNFGLNGISDVMSILINWFIISTLLQRNEKRKYLPHRIATYYDIAEMRQEIVYLWVEIYASSIPDVKYVKIKDLFTQEKFKLMREGLNLNDFPAVLPRRTWEEHIVTVQQRIKERAEQIVQRHSGYIDPYALSIIDRLIRGYINELFVNIPSEVNTELGVQRHSNLGLSIHQPWLDVVIELHEWCKNERKRLVLTGVKKLPLIREEYPIPKK